jgi:signal transduction histidine kinase
LGLPMVQRFAEEAGGRVEIDSAPGEGTTVRVLLPVNG